MIRKKLRNKKIFKLIESSVADYCKLNKMDYSINDISIYIREDNELISTIIVDYEKDHVDVMLISTVYRNLSMSKTTKLKSIYKSDQVAESVKKAGSSLWFFNDSMLVMSYTSRIKHSNLAILKSQLLLNIEIDIQNAKGLKGKLEELLSEHELVMVN